MTPTIAVALTQVPPDSLSVGGTATVSASVTNDIANAGVDWVAICDSAPKCGSFSPSHTNSGDTSTFTAPLGVPTHDKVTITALSATDHSKASTASLTILSTVTAIAITQPQPPPTSVPAGAGVILAATVTGDPSNLGVDWKATCTTSLATPPPGPPGSPVITSLSPTSGPIGTLVTFTGTGFGLLQGSSTVSFNGVQGSPTTWSDTSITVPVPNGAISGFVSVVVAGKSGPGPIFTVPGTPPGNTVNCSPPGFHSDAGGTVTFVVPGPNIIPDIVGQTVTLTAFPTADHNFSATFSFTVTAPISISLTQAPPNTMQTNATASVMAVVTNDTTNAGVDWQVTCQNTPCGTVTPAHTASGQAAIFTAPPVVPTVVPPDPTVTITAFATTSGSKVSTSVRVTIIGSVSVVISQGVPNNSIILNGTAPLVATVSNDGANAGVDWTVSCGSVGACGTFSPAHTASGATTTYTAPGSMPAGGTVTIKAASTTDPTQSATETVTIVASSPNNLLSGQFVLLLSATNSSNGPYSLGGVITGDGNGNIIKGNLDLADAAGNASPAVPIISPSTYSIGTDRRGQIHLVLNTVSLNTNFGANGAITLSVVFATPAHALVSESDSFGNATGTLDLQNAADLASFSGLNGTYSLSLSGAEVAPPYLGYFVAAAVTNTSYIADQSDHGVITSVPFTTPSNGLAGPIDANGEITLAPLNLGLPTQFNLDAWMIDANHFAITDWRDSAFGTPPVIVSGYLTAQPASPAVSGTYAFTVAGATATTTSQVAGGILTCGSTGVLDVAPLGGTVLTNAPVNVTCSGLANGRIVIAISGAATAGIKNFAAYPTVDQKLYLIELDGGSTGTAGPSGAGVAIQQTVVGPAPASSFSGKYTSNFRAATALGSQNFAAQIISDGVSALSGSADVNSFTATPPPVATPSLNAAISGSFTSDPTGRFPMTLTIAPATGQPSPQVATLPSACYIIDANSCLLLGLDATAPGVGILQLQPGL